jgi:hypothetical protein
VLRDPAFRAGAVSTALVPDLMARAEAFEGAGSLAGLAPHAEEHSDS